MKPEEQPTSTSKRPLTKPMTEENQQQVFKDWLNRYQALIFKVVRAYTTVPADRDDLFQEICLQLWQSVPGFRGDSAVSTWIYRIAFRTAMTWQKKARRDRDRAVEYADQQPVLQPAMLPDDRLEWLFKEINRLDEVDKSLALLLLDGCSYREMAAVLGISESNVGVKIYRIIKELTARAKILEANGI